MSQSKLINYVRSLLCRDVTLATPRTEDADAEAKGFYASLPRSLKTEMLVRSRIEDPKVLEERQRATKNFTVSELGKVGSLSEFPIPSTIENLMHGKWKKNDEPDARSKSVH